MPSLQVDAILFDMDGTLIDDSESYREAVRRTAEYLLRQPVDVAEVDEIKRLPGFNNDYDTTWTLVGKRIHGRIVPPDDADRGSYAYRHLRNIFQTYYLGDRLWSELSGEEPPFPWPEPLMLRETALIALETLERLRGFSLGIATSRPRAEALMALRQHRLDPFFPEEMVVGVEDAPREKPDPAPLLAAAQRLGCRQPVYVGDSISDALAAIAAGMPFIYVGRTALSDPDVERQVRHRVQAVDEIVALCEVMSYEL